MAGGDAANASNNGPAVANPQRLRFIPSASGSVRRAQAPSLPPAGRYPSFVQDGDPRSYHLPDKSNRGQHRRSIAVLLVRLGRERLFVEPDVFHTPIIGSGSRKHRASRESRDDTRVA